MSFIITEPLVRKLLSVVDVGLVAGMGTPEPGKMCVEAAISYALGEPHSDGPSCVDPVVRAGKIALNDCAWSTSSARAIGMREVAIAQLGSKGVIDQTKYVRLLAQYTMDEIVPPAEHASAYAAEFAAYAAAYAAEAEYAAECAAYAAECAAEYAAECDADFPLRLSAQLMVRALRECGSPGCEWLWLCEMAKP